MGVGTWVLTLPQLNILLRLASTLLIDMRAVKATYLAERRLVGTNLAAWIGWLATELTQ